MRVFVLFWVFASILSLLPPKVQAKSSKHEDDTTRRHRPRLVMLLTDTSEEAQRQRTQLFYDKLKNRFYRRDLTRRLYDLLIDDTPYEQPAPRSRPDPSEAMDYFQQFEGKRIEEVKIRKLPLFGPNVNDTTRTTNNWLEKLGNRAHIQTRDWVIRKNLLFEPGDLVNPETLYDNERLLRSMSYIRDVRIRLRQMPDDPGAVAVEVVTQDVLPLSINLGKSEFSSYSVGIQNNNIFGIGHRLTTEGLYRKQGTPALGYAGTYMVENLGGSFVNAAVHGAYTDIRRGGGLSLQRPFFTPDIRWAGGLDLLRVEQLSAVLNRNPALDTVAWYTNDWLDVWLGHSVPLSDSRPHPRGRDALVFSGRGIRTYHHDLPKGDVVTNDFFLNRKIFLASVGWVRRRYRRDAYIYSFGRTEDVPLGFLFNTTYGLEQQGEGALMYFGQLSGGWGDYFEKLGYIDVRLALSQYLQDGNTASRRLRSGSLHWISPLRAMGRYKFRHLARLEYVYGDRRLDHEFISVGEEEIRGVAILPLRGTQRLNASFESITFSPLQLVGFRLGAFLFADLSVLNSQPNLSLKGYFFHGYGAGIRIRNENLAFKTFQLRFSYHPGLGGGLGLSILGSPNKIFQGFLISKPQVLPFR